MNNPKLYFFVNPGYRDQIYYTQTVNVWEAFARHGAVLLYGDDILAVQPNPEDHVIGYGRIDAWKDAFFRFNPKNRWHYIVDESSAKTAPYDVALNMLQRLGYTHKNLVVTYQNAEHLAKLRANNVKYVIMPQTMPAIRPSVAKVHDIISSGQNSDTIYPTRTRLAALAGKHPALAHRTILLPSPGIDISTRRHNIIGENYYQLLDKYRLGIVCRAGNWDRMVGKYVEMGACHVLPVGDCPTYMPQAMKDAMVNVENKSNDWIVAELERLLASPDELQQRTDAYVAEVERRYLADDNASRVIKEILETT